MIRSKKAIAIIAICIPSICLGARLSSRKVPNYRAIGATLATSIDAIDSRQLGGAIQGPVALLAKPLDENDEPTTSSPHYAVDYSSSYLIAITGKSGLFSFAGHRHAVVATKWSASFRFSFPHLAPSGVSISIPVASLVIDSREARQKAGLGPGPNAADVHTIQQSMLGAGILDATRFPIIRFRSTSVDLDSVDRLRVAGTVNLHGEDHRVLIPVHYRRVGRRIEFDGEFIIRQTDYSLRPESVAGGTIKVNDKIAIRFHVVTTIVN